LGAISLLLFVGGIIWASISFANQMNNNVTYGNVFSHSFKAVATVTVIMIAFTLIATKLLFPESVDQAMENARIEMEKSGQSEETIDKALEMSKKFFIPFAIGGVLLLYMIVGAIAALIGAAVAKKNPTDPFTQPG
jgi:NADH:ubiquinone oxidoreductase subunit 6 (subunit J)